MCPFSWRIICLAALLLSSACPVAAQSLKWDAFGSAGGQVTSASINLGLTVGQPVTFTSLDASFIETVGFWHPFPPNVTAIDPGPETGPIASFRLAGIVPNPSAEATTIHFAVPAGAAQFTIEVIDLSGRVVRVLLSGTRAPGAHSVTWDGRVAGGSPAPSGIYFCQLRAGGDRSILRLALIR